MSSTVFLCSLRHLGPFCGQKPLTAEAAEDAQSSQRRSHRGCVLHCLVESSLFASNPAPHPTSECPKPKVRPALPAPNLAECLARGPGNRRGAALPLQNKPK